MILFKSGNFYISFDEDATVLNEIFNLKINELKNNIKVGFPINSLDKYIKDLNNLGINYLIISNKEIIKKMSFNNNYYNEYRKSVFEIVSVNNKLNRICDFVKSIKDIDIKKNVIKKMENIINDY